ncbi:Kelch-like protein 20, partial [Trichinella pseudospiralis]
LFLLSISQFVEMSTPRKHTLPAEVVCTDSGNNVTSPATSSENAAATVSMMHYISEKHPRAFLEAAQSLQRMCELCDVVIHCGSKQIFAHRLILAACSPYFRAMFTSEMAESRQSEVTIQGVDETALEALVNFCYTSCIFIEESNVQILLPVACLLQMQEIQDVCCDFLKKQLDPSNCLGIRAFADTHACRDLLRIADRFTQHNFQEVVESEEFMLLPVNQLIDIIASDELNIRSEEQVFKAVMAWVRHDLANRRHLLSQVLEHVRLPLCNAKFLVGTVSSDLLVKSDESARELVDEAKNYLLLPLERPRMQGPRTRPRKLVLYGEILYAVGGWCSGDAIASVERLDPRTNEWKCVCPMSKRRCGVGVAVLNDLLYAVGGHDGQSYLNSIERYDPHTNQWSGDVAPTSTCRTSVGVAVLDGYLYAVGGQDGISCLNVVERYDPNTNRWTKVSPMNTRRLGVAVSVLGGCLYAVGGSDGSSPLNTVERYDARVNKWYPVAPMGTRRKHHGCAVYNGFLYAVGGRDEQTELSSAERYNWESNTWSPVLAMNNRRSGVGLAVVNDQLFAVGGFDGATYLKTVELYDRETNHWLHAGSMNYRRLGGGVGVVRLANEEPAL